MTATITHQAIVLLALDRLEQIERMLDAKIKSGLNVKDIDVRVHYLAQQAAAMLSQAPRPQVVFPDRPFSTRLGTDVSMFAVMGSLGPEIPQYSALHAAGQSWAADIMRKGTPDANREAVSARSVDFLLKLFAGVESRIASLESGEQDAIRAKLRAYALGHLCRIAGNVMVNPYLDDVEWHYGTATHPTRLGRNAVQSAVDASVAQLVLRNSDATRRGAKWSAWWPEVDAVPSQFFDAYADAFTATYMAQGRPKGLAEFEQSFAAIHPPPDMSKALVRDGYEAYRSILQRGYDWTYGDWLLMLLPAFLPIVIAMPATILLKEGQHSLFSDAAHDGVKAAAEAFIMPLAATSLVPLGYSIYQLAWSSMGVERDTVLAVVLSGVGVITAALFAGTYGIAGSGLQWSLFYALPVALELFYLFYELVRRAGEKNHRLLGSVFLLHLALATIAPFGFLLFRGWLEKGAGDPLFWAAVFLWLLFVGGAWLLTAYILMDSASPEIGGDQFAAGQRHFVRAYDDSTLFFDPASLAAKVANPEATAPTLAETYYPSGRRQLLKIWWTGTGDMHIRPHDAVVEFSVAGTDGAADIQTLLAPVAPITLKEYAAQLERSVKDGGGKTGLKTALAFPDDLDYVLPAGETFSDHADIDDTIQTETDRDTRAKTFVKLSTDNTDSSYVLQHAPKARQAVRVGQKGIVPRVYAEATIAGTGTVSTVGGSPLILQGVGTRFLSFLAPGDIVEAPPGGAQATVVAVASDTVLTTTITLGAAAGSAFNRVAAADRSTELQGAAQAAVLAASPTTVGNAGATQFGRFFMPGDTIRIGAEQRVVTALASNTSLTVDLPFTPTAGAAYFRAPAELAAGYAFAPDVAADMLKGESVIEQAADFAALLCMGGASNMLTPAERAAAGAAKIGVNPVVQVFRNWNLDRRRLNEWKMLVTGGAVSEKRGFPDAADAMMPAVPANWKAGPFTGDATAASVGWLPLFRKWLDVARRPGESSTATASLHPGDATNLELSQAVAFLFDMPDPAIV